MPFDYTPQPKVKVDVPPFRVIDCLHPGVQVTQVITPFEILKEDTNTYLRYHDTDEPQLIKKIVIDGDSIKNYKTFAKWEDRATAEYVGINASFPGYDK